MRYIVISLTPYLSAKLFDGQLTAAAGKRFLNRPDLCGSEFQTDRTGGLNFVSEFGRAFLLMQNHIIETHPFQIFTELSVLLWLRWIAKFLLGEFLLTNILAIPVQVKCSVITRPVQVQVL
jgi:hypothetical protein